MLIPTLFFIPLLRVTAFQPQLQQQQQQQYILGSHVRNGLKHRRVSTKMSLDVTSTTVSSTTTAFDGTILSELRGDLAAVAEDAQFASLNYALSADILIEKAKKFIESSYGGKDTELLAETFEFIGPFVGPLNRNQYISALEGALNPQDGFPDLIGRQYG